MLTNKLNNNIVLWAAMILAMPGLRAQPATIFRDGSGYLAAGLESDAFLSTSLAYYHLVPGSRDNRASMLHAGIQVPVLLAFKGEGNHAFRLDAGYQWGGIYRERYCVDGRLDLFFMNHSAVLGTFRPVGAELNGAAGFRFRRSFLGIFCKWHHVLATHVTHSDYSKESYKEIIPGGISGFVPMDGWFSNTASMIGYGVRYSSPVRGRMALNVDIGAVNHLSEFTGMLDAMMIGQLPFMLEMKLFYRLQK